MKLINVHDANVHFSKLLACVERGEEVLIARAGEPIARLVPAKKKSAPVFGSDRGKLVVPDDFDAPLPDERLAAFDGGCRKRN
jgi:prevent-host-death family protein